MCQINSNNIPFINVDPHDLQLLKEHSASELYVDNGKLTIDSRFVRVSKLFYGTSFYEQQVSEVIFAVLKQVAEQHANNLRASPGYLEQIGVDHLVQKFAELKSISPKVLEELKKKEVYRSIENLLSPELNDHRTAKAASRYELQSIGSNYPKVPAELKNQERVWQTRWQKYLVAQKLGISAEINKGTTGSMIAKSIGGKNLGIIKGSNALSPLSVKIKQAVKKTIGEQLKYLKSGEFAQAHTEVAVHELDKILGWQVTARSACVDPLAKREIFQTFFKKEVKDAAGNVTQAGYVELEEALKNGYKNKTEFTRHETNQFQKVALLHFLTGNLDGHHENSLVKIVNNEIVAWKGIDNANSLVKETPSTISSKLLLKSYYKWAELNIAKQKFTPESVALIDDLVKDDCAVIYKWIEQLSQRIPEFLHMDKTEGNILEEMRKRIAVLKTMVTEEKTPAELAQIKTVADIEANLEKYPQSRTKVELERVEFRFKKYADTLYADSLIESKLFSDSTLSASAAGELVTSFYLLPTAANAT